MRFLTSRLAVLAAVLFVTLAVAQGGSPATVLMVSVTAALLAMAIAATLVVGTREVTVGSRAHAHRQALNEMPAPSHPSTAGRPMTRAPSRVVSAT
jgi:hypothetical protein